MSKRAPIHPGEILKEDFLEPLGLTGHRLALDLHVPATRVNEIVNGKRGITADTALRLARYFETDLRVQADLGARDIARDVRPAKALVAR